MPAMTVRREQVLAAAVTVLGSGGARALTHRAVDAEGDLPPGTTSNHFRTREALVDGILGHLSATERRAFDAMAPSPSPASVEDLVTVAAAMVRELLGPGRTLTIARHAILLEAAVRPELQPSLRAWTQQWWDLLRDLLTEVGAPEAEQRARLLLAYVDGLLTDQLARPDDTFDAESALRPVVTALAG